MPSFFFEEICKGLENRFKDNDIVSCFKNFNLTKFPSRQVGMASWGVTKLERLCAHFGEDKRIDEKEFCALVNIDAIRREFFAFKVQASTEWREKSFHDVWCMINWKQSLHGKYENLRIFADIARVQCDSTAQCERAFSVQNCIKTKTRNKLDTNHLECIMRVAMEDVRNDLDNVLMEAITLWRNSTKFR